MTLGKRPEIVASRSAGKTPTQDRSFSGDRPFSVQNQFPDAWYELNNPEAVVAQA
jgi:hypothetical protein